MNPDLIFLPVLVQVLLTIAVYIGLVVAKYRALKAGQVDETRRALHDDAWPDSVIKFNNNIRNQFEVPVLFYVLCVVLWALQATSVFVQVLAWLFVISRIVHAYIHTGSNYVPHRRKVFMAGCVMVVLLAGAALFAIVRLG